MGLSQIIQGFLLGWSVAWPPGPINAEMIRRGLGGHARSAIAVGCGACSGDFLWALVVASGVGLTAHIRAIQTALTIVSLVLLLGLAFIFLRGAWQHLRPSPDEPRAVPPSPGSHRSAYVWGLTLALSSPWNVAFWLAVLGRQGAGEVHFVSSLVLAAGVVAGALTWVMVLAAAVRLGARFATPAWEVTTRALTGLLMLFFACRLAYDVFIFGRGS